MPNNATGLLWSPCSVRRLPPPHCHSHPLSNEAKRTDFSPSSFSPVGLVQVDLCRSCTSKLSSAELCFDAARVALPRGPGGLPSARLLLSISRLICSRNLNSGGYAYFSGSSTRARGSKLAWATTTITYGRITFSWRFSVVYGHLLHSDKSPSRVAPPLDLFAGFRAHLLLFTQSLARLLPFTL